MTFFRRGIKFAKRANFWALILTRALQFYFQIPSCLTAGKIWPSKVGFSFLRCPWLCTQLLQSQVVYNLSMSLVGREKRVAAMTKFWSMILVKEDGGSYLKNVPSLQWPQQRGQRMWLGSWRKTLEAYSNLTWIQDPVIGQHWHYQEVRHIYHIYQSYIYKCFSLELIFYGRGWRPPLCSRVIHVDFLSKCVFVCLFILELIG